MIALTDLSQEFLIGVAHFPMLNKTYWAVQGAGAFINAYERLQPSDVRSLAKCYISVNGFQHPAAMASYESKCLRLFPWFKGFQNQTGCRESR
jgi:fructose-1,6-bisphosphatase/inositol monophosphatase family enzyme